LGECRRDLWTAIAGRREPPAGILWQDLQTSCRMTSSAISFGPQVLAAATRTTRRLTQLNALFSSDGARSACSPPAEVICGSAATCTFLACAVLTRSREALMHAAHDQRGPDAPLLHASPSLWQVCSQQAVPATERVQERCRHSRQPLRCA
jgi:hypothetical protein